MAPTVTSATIGRLAAEFAVIVIGVLVALGVDEAREVREDRSREAAYLRQLQDDLATTSKSLTSAISLEEGVIQNADRALATLNAPVLAQPDSLRTWILGATGSSATFHPTTGTITALVQSGELRLLTDDGLRRSLLQYHNAVTTSLRVLDGVRQHTWTTLERLGKDLSWAALLDPSAPQRFPIDWDVLASDPTFHGAVYDLRLAASNRLFALRTLSTPLAELEAHLVRDDE